MFLSVSTFVDHKYVPSYKMFYTGTFIMKTIEFAEIFVSVEYKDFLSHCTFIFSNQTFIILS